MELRNAKYVTPSMINVEINHPELGWIPFTCIDEDAHSTQQVFARVLNGEAGEITPADPGPTEEELLQQQREQMTCSNLQGRLAMADAGVLSTVEAAIAQSDLKTQIAWDRAQYFRRLSPMVLGMQTVLGWTDERMDELFRQAVLIEA